MHRLRSRFQLIQHTCIGQNYTKRYMGKNVPCYKEYIEEVNGSSQLYCQIEEFPEFCNMCM